MVSVQSYAIRSGTSAGRMGKLGSAFTDDQDGSIGRYT